MSEQSYLDLMAKILNEGHISGDRTGVGTRSLFGAQLRFDLQKGFPAITTKRLAWKSVVGELLWFLEGSGDERRLAEITHGTREGVVTIWTPNSLAPYWKSKAGFEGDLGRIYGVQWRQWRTPDGQVVDQLSDLISGLKRDPMSRRHIMTAWNPGELDKMALPPCHILSQFKVTPDGKLHCQLYQRSADMFLGVPFNIASYSLLTHILAAECGFIPGEFIWVGGDCHVYTNHIDQVKLQLSRDIKEPPRLSFDFKDIAEYEVKDFKLVNYDPHASIIAEMAV